MRVSQPTITLLLPSPPFSDGEPLTEYEKQRADRIARNNAYLESLGLKKNKEALRAMSTTKKKKRKSAPKPRVAPGEERRSSRMKNKADDLVMLSYDVDDNGKAVKSQPEPTDYGDGDYYEHKGRRFTGNRTISIDPEVGWGFGGGGTIILSVLS
jgi:hypothetical protein